MHTDIEDRLTSEQRGELYDAIQEGKPFSWYEWGIVYPNGEVTWTTYNDLDTEEGRQRQQKSYANDLIKMRLKPEPNPLRFVKRKQTIKFAPIEFL